MEGPRTSPSADARVVEGLRLLRRESEALLAELRALAPADWERPSNCPPWDMRTLVAHVATGAEFHRSSVERGLAGIHTPAASREERQALTAALAAAGAERILAELAANTERFEAFFAQLTPAQLETLAFHNHGLRPARWFVPHRLAEVAFHRWDVHTSLGREAPLAPETAAYLLPTLLEVNFPVLYTRGARGRGRVRLVTTETPPRAWLAEADGEALRVHPVDPAHAPSAAAPVPTVTLAPAALGLLVYGRVSLAALVAAGRAQLSDAQAAAVLPTLLGNP
ncbi:MAG TPA: maleylpyruvate isomerase family mycothiol-dependent enzyme [Chloroflexota bacterium]|nr:maleylpyruvate isomerase family mycothiol-dependent enzyme [Chloroflexota bacterium]